MQPNNDQAPIAALGIKRTYPNAPQVGAAAVVFNDNRVLLVKRNRPPGVGFWSIPGGRIRLGETLQQAAEREVAEETGIVIKAGETVFCFDFIDRDESGNIRYHYVVIDLAGEYVSGDVRPGDDAAEARWVSREGIASLKVNPSTRSLLKEKYDFY